MDQSFFYEFRNKFHNSSFCACHCEFSSGPRVKWWRNSKECWKKYFSGCCLLGSTEVMRKWCSVLRGFNWLDGFLKHLWWVAAVRILDFVYVVIREEVWRFGFDLGVDFGFWWLVFLICVGATRGICIDVFMDFFLDVPTI